LSALEYDRTILELLKDKTVRLWDAVTAENTRTLVGYNNMVTSVPFSPNSKTVASGSIHKTARLWDAAMGEERQNQETSRIVSKLTFSNDGSNLAPDIGQLDLGLASVTHEASVIKLQITILLDSS
jgi:WD40 repeat protein